MASRNEGATGGDPDDPGAPDERGGIGPWRAPAGPHPANYVTSTAAETRELGRKVGSTLERGAVVALFGGLGVGKTVLVSGIAESLGISGPITSPTFTLINEYPGPLPFFHVDLYRIENESEFLAIGGDELLDPDGVVVIEWSEKIERLIDENCIRIRITLRGADQRDIEIHWPHGPRARS